MLIEILIVIAIITMVTGGIAFAVIKQKEKADAKTALTEAMTIRAAVNTRTALEAKEDCPSVRQLIDEELLDRSARTKDPWGKPYRVQCADRHVVVVSNGRDRMAETEDDIRAPPKEPD